MQTIQEGNNSLNTLSADVADSAVGVSRRQWFVAVVKRNTEKKCRERLQQQGIECYVATRTETRQWRNGMKKQVEHVVISSIVFVKVTESERREIVNLPFIFRFMTDKTGKRNEFGFSPMAIIPDSQIKTLQFMLYNSDSDVHFSELSLRLGDKVRVVRGNLAGLCGNIVKSNGATYVVVSLNILGTAMTRISISDVVKDDTL